MAAYREHRYLAQDGLSLYYRDYGDPLSPETPLLCLPGLTRNSKDFHLFASRLSETRRVVCPDYRGRGESDRDPDAAKYHPAVHVNDLHHLLAVAGLHRATVVGTSFGGYLAMGMALWMPGAVHAVVLNDVGPEVPDKGLSRIMRYIGRDNPQPDWDAAVAELKRRFPGLSLHREGDWLAEAKASWREGDDGILHVDWDTRLAATVAGARGEVDPWILFGALRGMPVLAMRAGDSDVLAADTLIRMSDRHPGLTAITVPNRIHPLSLTEPQSMEAIDEFLARV